MAQRAAPSGVRAGAHRVLGAGVLRRSSSTNALQAVVRHRHRLMLGPSLEDPPRRWRPGIRKRWCVRAPVGRSRGIEGRSDTDVPRGSISEVSTFEPLPRHVSRARARRSWASRRRRLALQITPANSDWNPYTAYWVTGRPPAVGTGSARRLVRGLAAWAWRRAGVSLTYGFTGSDINAWSASFYFWGLATGNWHPLSSGYQPRPGDVAV